MLKEFIIVKKNKTIPYVLSFYSENAEILGSHL